jgi:hypothetical protein
MNRSILSVPIALSAVFAACSPCSLGVEVSRIQSDQSGVVDCGTLTAAGPALAVQAAATCARQAIDTRTPFRVFGQNREIQSAYYAFVSRRVGSEYTVFGLGFVDSNSPAGRINVTACRSEPSIEVVSFRDGTAHLTWACSDIDRSPEALGRLYSPPSSIPNGQICPLR